MDYRDDDYGRRGRERGDHRRGRDEDRGFFEKAGEEIRSWFGDDDDHRRRERGWESGGGRGTDRWHSDRGGRGSAWGRYSGADMGRSSMAGGWGNQSGEAWNRDRPGVHDEDRLYGRGEREGWFTDSEGGERGRRYGGARGREDRDDRHERDDDDRYGGGMVGYGSDTGVPEAELYGGTGFGGAARGRRFDRVDAGSTGTHGSHPIASHSGEIYGASAYGSRARERALVDGYRKGRRSDGRQSGPRGDFGQDPHYEEWRNRQMSELDRDYEEWRREHQSRFDQEFGSWRERRQGQRRLLGKVEEHMEVVGSDGTHVGTVDKVRGDRIILTKSDENAGGVHHSISCGRVESVDTKVTLNCTAEEAMREWRNEERSRALFEREDQGSDGPHVLNRSFAGTYDDDENRNR